MRQKLCYFPLILLLLSGSAFALEVRGTVHSIGGTPVADALVLHRPTGAQTRTDAAGAFLLDLQAEGSFRLEVIHPDYLDGEFIISPRQAGRPLNLVLTPSIRQYEEVTVTALRYPEPLIQIPAATTLLEATTLEETQAPNITEALSSLPGVVPLGSGGFSLVPSIRGLARNRILLLINSARVVSDRRTGPSASFVSPEDIDRIEVLRSPSSVFYGSDAIGGVVQIFTKSAPTTDGVHGTLHAGYGSVNKENVYGLALSGAKNGFGLYLSYQDEKAADYRSPHGRVPYSYYGQGSLFGKLSYSSDRREVELSFLGARGTDIGKPNRSSLTKPTWYPRENQNLANVRWLEKNVAGGDLTLNASWNPNFLETRTQKVKNLAVTQDTFSRTEGTDFGVQLNYGRGLGRGFRLLAGADLFGRGGVGAVNTDTYFDSQGRTTRTASETPYADGRRSDVGLYLSADYGGLSRLDLVGGVRWDHISQAANPGGGTTRQSYRYDAVTGFLAASYRLTDSLLAFANASRAYRAPGLSELFYTGITGRGVIIANPDLNPEVSLNIDFGLKWISKRVFAAAYGFVYHIDGFIDRYLVGPSTYTYSNVENGRIQGLEFETEVFPVPGWKLFGNFAAMTGRSTTTDARLNDIPPTRAVVGTRVWIRRLSLEVSATVQGKKDTPGPAEIAIPEAQVFGFRVGYDFGRWSAYLIGTNIFNEFYAARPDPEAMEEPGRNFILGLRYNF